MNLGARSLAFLLALLLPVQSAAAVIQRVGGPAHHHRAVVVGAAQEATPHPHLSDRHPRAESHTALYTSGQRASDRGERHVQTASANVARHHHAPDDPSVVLVDEDGELPSEAGAAQRPVLSVDTLIPCAVALPARTQAAVPAARGQVRYRSAHSAPPDPPPRNR